MSNQKFDKMLINQKKNKQKDMAFFSIKKKSLVLCMLACGYQQCTDPGFSQTNLLNSRKTM
jgi:hypothetical protein